MQNCLRLHSIKPVYSNLLAYIQICSSKMKFDLHYGILCSPISVPNIPVGFFACLQLDDLHLVAPYLQTLNVSNCKKLIRLQLKCPELLSCNLSLCGMFLYLLTNKSLVVKILSRLLKLISNPIQLRRLSIHTFMLLYY